jgi:hypothetical protein
LATTMNSITMKEHTKQNMTNDKLWVEERSILLR